MARAPPLLLGLLLLWMAAPPTLAQSGPGSPSLYALTAPGPVRIAPGAYYAVEFDAAPGTNLALQVAKSKGEVDVLVMNGSQFAAYKAAVAAGGGPISYEHPHSPLFLNSVWQDAWQVPEGGRYAVVVDNTPLPVGGGPGREEAVVNVALSSDRPPPSPPPAAVAGLPGWLLQAAVAGIVVALFGWRAVKRARAPGPRGRR